MTLTIPISDTLVTTLTQVFFFGLGFALGWWSQKHHLI